MVTYGSEPWSRPSMPHVHHRVIALAALLAGCSAAPVTGLGPDGRLKPCPATPNCVSSDAEDRGHRIAPLDAGTDPEGTWQALMDLLEADRRFTIKARGDGYLHAEARTAILRFVDDLEFQLRPAEGVIAVRSASRVGYSDLGTNRRRLEALRERLARRSAG